MHFIATRARKKQSCSFSDCYDYHVAIPSSSRKSLLMSDPLLTIRNNHSPSCGDPPIVNNSADCYVGYFENMHGEQWVFTYDRATKTAMIRGGDIGWNTVHDVRDGKV